MNQFIHITHTHTCIHDTNQTIIADGTASFMLGKICSKASIENPSHVCLKSLEYFTYPASIRKEIHNEIDPAMPVPTNPSPNTCTNKYVIKTCASRATNEHTTSGITTVCVWRNLRMHCIPPYANRPGMSHFRYTPAMWATSGCCCSKRRISSEKNHRRETRMQKAVEIIRDDWR